MITFITGLPGSGKTLYALWYIKQKADKENREVYYHNIKDLNPDVLGRWSECNPEEWYNLPDGSIVVLDECQFVFPKKPTGSKLPEHYEKLAVHRHKGLDIFLITQHPSLVDNFVRKLAGQHFHSVRKFGLQRSTIYEWSATNPAPENASSQKSAVTLQWSYPKEVYGWYKSAEVHTVKRKIPAKLVIAVAFVVALPVIGFSALNKYQHRFDAQKEASKPVVAGSTVPNPVAASAQPVSANGGAQIDPLSDIQRYAWMETERIKGLPQTKPKYDQLTVPTRVPIPAMCIQIGDARSKAGVRCKCYTQQGTPMQVEFSMCMGIAQNGMFQDFDADRDRAQLAKSEASVQVLKDRPDAELPSHASSGPAVAVLGDVPDTAPRQVRVSGYSALGK